MKENLDLKGGRKWTEEADRKTQAGKPLSKRFQEKSLPFFGRGGEGGNWKGRPFLQVARFCHYLTVALGSLWLPAGDPLIPGAGSERREEDSFDSDSTATLLK